MKKQFLLLLFLSLYFVVQATVSKTVNVTAGGLSSALTYTELTTVTNLTVTGTIDATDFVTMRDNMPSLAVLDISAVTIAAYNGSNGTFTDTSYPANGLPEWAFCNSATNNTGKTTLTTIILPSSVTSIGDYAFDDCTGLTNVTIGNSVTSIGDYAFNGCRSLISITIPSSVTSIGEEAFWGCVGLTSITIPSSVTSIGNGAFSGCSSLTSVIIPSSVTSIGNGAFEYCSGLTSVTIPSSVTSIGNNAFSYCNGLTNVTIGNSVTSIGDEAFVYCSGLTTITLPNSVTSIGTWAFVYCSGLTTITLPYSVTSIGGEAFYGCTALNSIIADSSIPVDLSASPNVFTNVPTSTCILYVPSESKSAYQTANQWSAFTHIDANPTTLTVNSIAGGGLSAAITNAGGNLAIITNLTVTGTIDASDFVTMRDHMPLLAVLDISGATIMGYTGTGGTAGTTSTTYPANELPEWAFYNASTYTGKTSLTTITLPNSITSIGDGAFEYCSGLTTITLPNSVSSIADGAFGGCSGLTTITLPGSVTSIGNEAFGGCSGLTTITLPNSIASIGGATFNGCSGLTTITLPGSVTSIGNEAFYGCSGLTMITLPGSVTSIGVEAFYGCRGLTSITAEASTPIDLSASTSVFIGVPTSTCILHVPSGSITAYADANQWSAFTHIVEMTTTAVYTVTSNSIDLYPNPATEGFFIKGLNGSGILTLLDISGKTLLTQQVSGNEYVPISTFPKGLYIVKITTAEGTIEKKVLKE